MARHRVCPPGAAALPLLAAAPLISLLSLLHPAGACTVLAVSKGASADGHPMVSHSDDAESGADARLCYVPAADHEPDSTRPVYFSPEDYPRYVGIDRGDCYLPNGNFTTPMRKIGDIPQVNHTFAYFEATYGVMNEHGLGIGESTCSGVFGAKPAGQSGSAILSVDALSQIAMERATRARDAVRLIGDLAVRYGFYGAGSFEGTAESLVIGDSDEVWIFHVLPDPTGASAIWAAQRVPDGHATVVANMFVIRHISDSDDFMYSDSVKTVAKEQGWWAEGQPLDFTAIYSDGEYEHKFYSGRRMWGAYRLFGVPLPDDYIDLRHERVYPATARPSAPVGRDLLFKIHRYSYEGTKYDMTKGIAAGPWGDPDRLKTQANATGSWERSIALFRTSFTHLVQMRPANEGAGPVMWFGPHAAATTCFIPLTTAVTQVPAPYLVADPNHLDRQSAYWAHRYAANVAKLKYSYAVELVHDAQKRLETEGAALVARLDRESPSPQAVNKALANHADEVMRTFWELPDRMIESFADGWKDDGDAMGYPEWWLKAVRYQDGPPPTPQEQPVQVAVSRPFAAFADRLTAGFWHALGNLFRQSLPVGEAAAASPATAELVV